MDYNIYIHDKTSSQSKPTQARKSGGTNTTAQKQTSGGTTASGGFSLKALKNGFGNKMPVMGKVGIVLYAIKKAADLTEKAIDFVEPFVTRETGDYRFKVAYGNFKIVKNLIFNPIGAFVSDITVYQQNRLFNKRQEEERLLLGDSFINSNNRKV